VREAIFNMLKHGRFLNHEYYKPQDGDLIEGQMVVDIFCGTGMLGLEALSRGAEHVTLIDGDSRTLEVARANVRNLGANANIMRSDSTNLPRAHHQCGLAFMDPPYNSKLVAPALKSLRDNGWLADRAVIILEHGHIEEVNEPPEGFKVLDTRLYAKTRVTVLQYHS
jgi:16S rRNA (guanine966-N2)-methyltransferase